MAANDSPAFDPYHRWLGIPPSDQPVNYYRLLGVALFESESEVIAAAADRQMAHVKQFATGQYRAESQRLLNELAKARVALVNLQRKAEYDRALERRLTEQRPAAPVQRVAAAALIAPAVPVENAEPAGFAFERMPARSVSRGRKRQQSNQSMPLLLVMIGVTVITGILAYAALTAPPAAAEREEKLQPQSPVAQTAPVPRVQSPQRIAPVKRESPTPTAELTLPGTLSAPVAPTPERDRPERDVIPKKKSPAKPPKIEVIDLDLENRQQNVLLNYASGLRVALLKDCKSRAKIVPAGGQLAVDRDVKIEIDGERPVTLTISLKERPNDQVLVTVESLVTTDDGRELPFTLANVGRVMRQVSKRSEQAYAGQSSLEAEKRQLTAWLGGPGMKPLIDVNSARSRLRAIESLLPEQVAIAESLQAELATAERVQELAEHLHEDCSIELEIESVVD